MPLSILAHALDEFRSGGGSAVQGGMAGGAMGGMMGGLLGRGL
jgi:hypothetical protein